MPWRKLVIVLVAAGLVGCGGSAPIVVPQSSLRSISVTPPTGSYKVPSSQQFSATGHYSDGSTKDLTQTVTWSSSDVSVATVSNSAGSQGMVTMVGAGNATVSAAYAAYHGTAAITVSNSLTSIAITPPGGSYNVPGSQQFTATGHYSDGSTRDLTQSVTWSSSNISVATISNSSGSQGVATMVGPGNTNIIAASGSVQASVAISVSISLTSIAINPSSGSYAPSSSQQFTATGHYSDGSTKDITQSVTWSSSDTSVATISNSPGTQGVATMVGTGSTSITAALGSVQTSVAISVSISLTSIDLTPAGASYQLPATQQFTATGRYNDGSTKDLTQSVAWSSSNTSVATISNSSGSQGLATLVGSGSADITAASGSVQGSVSVSVASSVTISISPGFASVTVTHQTAAFTATVQGTSNTAVTWSVDGVAGGNSTLGTVSITGLYTPPDTKGFHTITATSQADLGKTVSAQVAVSDVAGVYTRHYDNTRAGQNSDEIVLTPQNVNTAQFGKIISYPVDGIIYGQPLYVANVNLPGLGYRNVVYVGTTYDEVYAFDADGGSSSPIWETNLLNTSAGETSVPCSELPDDTCGMGPKIGIIGTPVIDPTTGTLYVDALSEISGTYYHKLHALDLTTGAEKFGGPVTIQGSVPGVGDGTDGTNVTFNAVQQLQRPGLLLANGNVYVGFASYGDVPPYHGWLFAYSAATLQQVGIFNDTPDGSDGGIWQGGGAIAADASGNIYLATGNGTFTADAGGRDYGDSIIKLSPTLSVLDYFTPYNQDALDTGDHDLGSSAPLLLPDQSGPYAHLLFADGKPGEIYLVNRDNLGHFHAGDDSQIVQSIPGATGRMMTTPVYWNGAVYLYDQQNNIVEMYGLQNGQVTTSPLYQLATQPGKGIALSGNGDQAGILWLTQVIPGVGGLLTAYDATNLTELYDTTQAGTRDTPGGGVTFQVPLIVNGKVYLGSQGELDVYGLLPH